jgi:hypothetical protein
MNLIAPSSGRCGLRYWIITRVILRRRHVVECVCDNRSGIGSEITHVRAGPRSRLRSNWAATTRRAAYNEALTLFKQVANPLGQANVLRGLGDLENKLGRYDQARAECHVGPNKVTAFAELDRAVDLCARTALNQSPARSTVADERIGSPARRQAIRARRALFDASKPDLMLQMKFPGLSQPLPMLSPENTKIFRVTPTVISVLDYSKGFGHTDLVTC